MKNWNKIMGPITVKYYDGRNHTYNTIEEAVYFNGNNVDDYNYGHLQKQKYIEKFDFWQTEIKGDYLVFIDELGLIIPPWKIKEVYNNLPKMPYISWRWNKKKFDFVKEFRKSPVPGTSKWKGGSGRRHRKVLNEKRANSFLKYDEDTKEYNFKSNRRNQYYGW